MSNGMPKDSVSWGFVKIASDGLVLVVLPSPIRDAKWRSSPFHLIVLSLPESIGKASMPQVTNLSAVYEHGISELAT